MLRKLRLKQKKWFSYLKKRVSLNFDNPVYRIITVFQNSSGFLE